MLDYAQLLGMNGGNAQAATLMQGALQPGASMLNSAGPTPVGQNPMTGGPSRFSMGTAIGQAGQPGTLMGQAQQQIAAAPPRPAPIAPMPVQARPEPAQQNNGMIVGYQPGALRPASEFYPGNPAYPAMKTEPFIDANGLYVDPKAPGMAYADPASYGGLYVDPMGKVYAYNQATQNMAPWNGGKGVSYGLNEGGGAG